MRSGQCGRNRTSLVLDTLATLVDANLLRTAAPRGGEARFSVLETVRQYAEERLAASGQRNASSACTPNGSPPGQRPWTRSSEGPQSVAWLARAWAEADNLRAAIDYLDLHGRFDEQLELTVHCMGLWFDCGLEGEGRDRLDRALASCDETAPALLDRPGLSVVPQLRGATRPSRPSVPSPWPTPAAICP